MAVAWGPGIGKLGAEGGLYPGGAEVVASRLEALAATRSISKVRFHPFLRLTGFFTA